MANEVVDIRRRIEEMRNEVSAAIVSNRDLEEASRIIGKNADISVKQAETQSGEGNTYTNDEKISKDKTSSSIVSDETITTYKGLEMATKMPAFQLNVRNQVSNRLMLTMIGIQLITNIVLILMVFIKLG